MIHGLKIADLVQHERFRPSENALEIVENDHRKFTQTFRKRWTPKKVRAGTQ